VLELFTPINLQELQDCLNERLVKACELHPGLNRLVSVVRQDDYGLMYFAKQEEFCMGSHVEEHYTRPEDLENTTGMLNPSSGVILAPIL